MHWLILNCDGRATGAQGELRILDAAFMASHWGNINTQLGWMQHMHITELYTYVFFTIPTCTNICVCRIASRAIKITIYDILVICPFWYLQTYTIQNISLNIHHAQPLLRSHWVCALTLHRGSMPKMKLSHATRFARRGKWCKGWCNDGSDESSLILVAGEWWLMLFHDDELINNGSCCLINNAK